MSAADTLTPAWGAAGARTAERERAGPFKETESRQP